MAVIASPLLAWYRRNRRELPWRRTQDPYRIWVSEIMLQQTRVAAVLRCYQRFLRRFPDVGALAHASESEVLAAWTGLGYYARARHLHHAAGIILERGGFPRDYAALRRLPGVGDYTAAAIASIAFHQPHAVLDGNVVRVLARWSLETGDIRASATRARLRRRAEELLDRRRPGDFNQALMELGATVCLPRAPRCPACPLRASCRAFLEQRTGEIPMRSPAARPARIEQTLLVIERRGRLLLWQRGAEAAQLAGFWELPRAEQLPEAALTERLGRFGHAITTHVYVFEVVSASVRRTPPGLRWVARAQLQRLPLSTASRKALALRDRARKVTSAVDAGPGRRSRRDPNSGRRRKDARPSAPPAAGLR